MSGLLNKSAYESFQQSWSVTLQSLICLAGGTQVVQNMIGTRKHDEI